jgi:hypothetical protein
MAQHAEWMAVCWDRHSGDARREMARIMMEGLSLPIVYKSEQRVSWINGCMRNWDREVAVRLRRIALLTLLRQNLSDDLVQCIAAFWEGYENIQGTNEIHTQRM